MSDLETLLAKEQKKVTEGRGDEAKIVGLQQRLAALLQLQPSSSTESNDAEVASTPQAVSDTNVETPTTTVGDSTATTESTTSTPSLPTEYDHTRVNLKKASFAGTPSAMAPPVAPISTVVDESSSTISTMKSSAKAEAKAEKKAEKLDLKAAKKMAKAEEKEEKKSEKVSKSSKSKHNK